MKHYIVVISLLLSSGFVCAQAKSSNPQVIYDSVLNENYFLFILDSTNSVQSPKKFKLDDNDCYIQVNGTYAVISYRLRGKNEFASGQIRQTGSVNFNNSTTYKTITFQGDNRYEESNMGKRFYIAYSEKNSDNEVDVVLCTNTFTPSRFFKSHKASELEMKKLKNRSNSQNSTNGF